MATQFQIPPLNHKDIKRKIFSRREQSNLSSLLSVSQEQFNQFCVVKRCEKDNVVVKKRKFYHVFFDKDAPSNSFHYSKQKVVCSCRNTLKLNCRNNSASKPYQKSFGKIQTLAKYRLFIKKINQTKAKARSKLLRSKYKEMFDSLM